VILPPFNGMMRPMRSPLGKPSPHSQSRRFLGPALGLAVLGIAVLLGACQQGGARVEQLASTVDSLESSNRTLQSRVQALRDTLRSGAERPPGERGTKLEPAVFFPSGSAWLTDRGKETLDGHAETIRARYGDREFRIQGYTDNVPIGDSLRQIYPSNWYLSAQRAAAVAHYLDQAHDLQVPTLEIGAFGPQSPVAPNETAEGRRQNRRVEIVIAEPRPDPGF
jgi:chemotaxis protein MotB